MSLPALMSTRTSRASSSLTPMAKLLPRRSSTTPIATPTERLRDD
ncbi:hypothetical protein CaCOL14_000891 [Colletotrichum acutatum]